MSRADPYRKVRQICLALPEAVEKPFGGHTSPAFRVRDKIFVFCFEVGRPAVNVKGAPGVQEALVEQDPGRYFVPAYTGPKGWVGAYVDGTPDWDEIAELIEDSYRLVAPKRLVSELDGRAPSA
ncbi:MAG TPA: MmcQ/YjbR family DNA-binding protein [Actinomycetota bacterium]|nr:MmcQ/YjbR family DNA-binding protein [Actinomycetota bacterium]